MAPEVIEGNFDEKCDVWSIGCIVYTMLTGVPPFNARSDAEVLAKVRLGKYSTDLLYDGEFSQKCISFIEKLLVQDPKERPSVENALKEPWIADYIDLKKQEKVDPEAQLETM